MKPNQPPRQPLHCPKCGAGLAALAGRQGDGPWKAPYTDPKDGVRMYRCIQDGRAAVMPDGRILLEADLLKAALRRRA